MYYQTSGDHAYIVNPRLDLDSLFELLGIYIEEEDADTVGGLIFSRLGYIPEEGEILEIEGWRFTVLSLDGRRIAQVRVEQIVPSVQAAETLQPHSQSSTHARRVPLPRSAEGGTT